MLILFDLLICTVRIMILCLKNEEAVSIKKFVALFIIRTFCKFNKKSSNSE